MCLSGYDSDWDFWVLCRVITWPFLVQVVSIKRKFNLNTGNKIYLHWSYYRDNIQKGSYVKYQTTQGVVCCCIQAIVQEISTDDSQNIHQTNNGKQGTWKLNLQVEKPLWYLLLITNTKILKPLVRVNAVSALGWC